MDFGSIFGFWIVVGLIVNALLALLPAFIAEQKGRSFAAFWWLSFLTTVLIGLIAVIAIPATSSEDRARRAIAEGSELPEYLKCPQCAEFVKSEAQICKHCQYSVGPDFQKELETRKARLEESRLTREAEIIRLEQLADQRREARSTFVRKPIFYIPAALLVAGLVAAPFVAEFNRVQADVLAEKERDQKWSKFLSVNKCTALVDGLAYCEPVSYGWSQSGAPELAVTQDFVAKEGCDVLEIFGKNGETQRELGVPVWKRTEIALVSVDAYFVPIGATCTKN